MQIQRQRIIIELIKRRKKAKINQASLESQFKKRNNYLVFPFLCPKT